jgi:exopolysaccharide biosynthesis polyprenyl glycosylphosphotransferase
MPPPPAASHAADSGIRFDARSSAPLSLAGLAERWSDPREWSRVRLGVDVVVLYLAVAAALVAEPMKSGAAGHWLALVFPPLTVACLHLRRQAPESLRSSAVDTACETAGAVSLASMAALALGSVVGTEHPVDVALRLWLFAGVYLTLARIVLLSVRRHIAVAAPTPTLIMGAGEVGEQLVKRLHEDSSYGLRPVGFLDADPKRHATGSTSTGVPVLGGADDLSTALKQTGARRVILAFSSEPDHLVVTKLRACEQQGVQVSVVPRLFESFGNRATIDHIGGVPLVSLVTVNPKGWQFACKHAFDRCFAAIALFALGPVLAAVALAVRLSSPGPILFRQRRVGRDGREFDVLKFRTMRAVPSASVFELKHGCAPGGVEGDDRRTRIGTYLRELSLDELPQLLNVLRGDMSLVGPRPERPEYVARFESEVRRYDDRHRVKAGITGWAQVNGLRGQTSIDDRVEWDNYYIQNWSLALDVRIIAMTIGEILRAGG